MKIFSFIIFLIFSHSAIAQDSLLYGIFPVIEGKVNYTQVVELDSLTKDQIFIKIKDWAVQSYKSQKVTLQAEDKDQGYIAYQGYLPIIMTYQAGLLTGSKYKVDLYHTLKFFIKDNKLKFVFTDLTTLSHDVGSNMMAKETGKPTGQIAIEIWEKDLQIKNIKKLEKISIANKKNASEIDIQVKALLDNLLVFLRKKKSDFDF